MLFYIFVCVLGERAGVGGVCSRLGAYLLFGPLKQPLFEEVVTCSRLGAYSNRYDIHNNKLPSACKLTGASDRDHRGSSAELRRGKCLETCVASGLDGITEHSGANQLRLVLLRLKQNYPHSSCKHTNKNRKARHNNRKAQECVVSLRVAIVVARDQHDQNHTEREHCEADVTGFVKIGRQILGFVGKVGTYDS